MFFSNKVVFITGATSGIGKAAAEAFARQNARVCFTGRRRDQGEKVATELRAEGADVLFVHADVSDEAAVRHALSTCAECFGGLDIAVNNAGIEGARGALTDLSVQDFHALFNINVLGVFLAMKHELPLLRERGRGAVVNTASILGLIAMPGTSLYCATKHAVVGLTKAAALEEAEHHIRVNAVCPAAIATPMIERVTGGEQETLDRMNAMHPLGRMGRSEEIAAAILWLCSEKASFVTGHCLTVDGGYTAR